MARAVPYQRALCVLTASPGARAYYDAHDPGATRDQGRSSEAGIKLVGILHGCLTHRTLYDAGLAWPEVTMVVLAARRVAGLGCVG